MLKWIAWAGLLFPMFALACESTDRQECQRQFRQLVSYRAEAIDNAFGNLSGLLPEHVEIKFVSGKEPEYRRYNGQAAYDAERRALIFPRRVLAAKLPNPLKWAAYYWPLYENEQYRNEFAVIETVDNVLWSAFMQEAARAQGLTWPHKDCTAVDVGRRLPCEMVISGIVEYVKALRAPLFNANRIDRIWPENFTEFRNRFWRTDQEYLDVQRYGGIMLIHPLIDEFGVARTLKYVAKTPFRVEGGNMRLAAERYQERAREALRSTHPENDPSIITSSAVVERAPVHASRARAVMDDEDPSGIE
ncbi:MAG TPA: hypothetical protein VF161_11250 [Steroidobacteraceae bacterium]|jgi:hypothetical protein